MSEDGRCVPALARACQIAIGEALGSRLWLERAALATAFENLPRPSSYAEATLAAGLVAHFTRRFADLAHRMAHGGDPTSCRFRPFGWDGSGHAAADHPFAWEPGAAVCRWFHVYEASLKCAGCLDIGACAERLLRESDGRKRVPAMARELGCSLSVLQRRFKMRTGRNLAEFGRRLRAAEAIERFSTSDVKAEAVARELGWQGKKGLYGALRSLTGLTPGAVRRLPPETVARIATELRRGRRRMDKPLV